MDPPKGMQEINAPANAFLVAVDNCFLTFQHDSTKRKWYSCAYCRLTICTVKTHLGYSTIFMPSLPRRWRKDDRPCGHGQENPMLNLPFTGYFVHILFLQHDHTFLQVLYESFYVVRGLMNGIGKYYAISPVTCRGGWTRSCAHKKWVCCPIYNTIQRHTHASTHQVSYISRKLGPLCGKTDGHIFWLQ